MYTQVSRCHNDKQKFIKLLWLLACSRTLIDCFGHDIICASTNLEYHQLQTSVAKHPQPPDLRSCVNMFNLSLSGDREGALKILTREGSRLIHVWKGSRSNQLGMKLSDILALDFPTRKLGVTQYAYHYHIRK